MIIRNGLVFDENKTFVCRDLYVEKGMIVENIDQVTDRSIVDAEGLYVLPGLVDVHSHGAVGCDFSDADAEGLKKILKYERAHGITSYCPTSMTLPASQLKQIFATAAEVQAAEVKEAEVQAAEVKEAGTQAAEVQQTAETSTEEKPAAVAGINMEGPFLDPHKKGAHVEEHIIAPDIEFFRECNESCKHMIRLVTLAPNMPGAMEFIKELHEETVISLGHTGADFEQTRDAVRAGAKHVTHLYNAMKPFAHREPGLIGAAAEDDECMVELISDGIHIHESVVRATFRLFPDRVVLISDSMRATGMEDGTYDLGGQQVTVHGKLATLEDGTIAGSATNLYDCMRTAVSFGIPLEEAVAAASMNPARSIGIYDKVGSLTPGKRADILLADKELNLVKVI